MKKSILLAFSFFPLICLSVVDTRSAGYSKTFLDFKAPSSSYPLEIKRTYNSRSIYNGLYGFGWCSNIETRVSVLPDNMIKVVECGGGMEILYHPKGKVPDVNLYVDRILEELTKRKVKMSTKNLKKLKSDLKKSKNLRANFLDSLNIRGTANKNVRYYAKGRAKEYLIVTSKGYVRKLPNNFTEVFDKEGRLIQSSFKKQNKIDITWSDRKIVIMDQKGRRLILSLNTDGKVNQASYKKVIVTRYTHRNGNLVVAVNSDKETFRHNYDNLNNLIKNTYPDNTTEELTYNAKKDWVVGFKDRKGCKESYSYGVNPKNDNHYFSTVKKICGRKIVNKSKYEFWHKNKPGGGKYLHRARAKINGRIKTDVIYHSVFGTPTSFFKNGVRTSRKYYGNGFLQEKNNIFQQVKYENYNKKCRKPELVKVAYKNPNPNNKPKIVRRESIAFVFDNKCQLNVAKKSKDEWMRISHDGEGRIHCMEDQSRKKICLKWHKTLNKPSKITRVGVGSLEVIYNKKGEAVRLKGIKKDPTVVAQVTSVFNSFLTTLGPVAEEMVIL